MNDTIRVLIVDDEERFRKTTAAILTRHGFDVQAVGSGIEAIEAIKKNDIDVVVLDVKMPGMDGNEAFREIRKIRPHVAVLMLTGHGTPESALKGLHSGAFDYLMKPCAIDLLARRIREAFAKEGGLSQTECRVRHLMVPLFSFSTIHEDQPAVDAIKVLVEGFVRMLATSTVQETVHRSILVLDADDNVTGFIALSDLLKGLQPPYMRLLTERPSMADSIHLESPSYSGMFTIMARDLANKRVREIMPDDLPLIDADANLMEAVNTLLNLRRRRLLVKENDTIVGVIREQDLFFEMANIIRQHGTSHM